MYECPACECLHHFQTDKAETPFWTFNNDLENPTVSPSIRIRGGAGGNDFVCHFHIKNGHIEFCADSTHKLAGQVVKMSEWK